MEKATTYLGASSTHLHCKNYKFQSNTPLQIFGKDEICCQLTWIDIEGCTGTLDQTTFKNLPELKIINFDKCNLDGIEENTFSSLANLSSISIRKSVFPLNQNVFRNCKKIDNICIIQMENGINDPIVFKDLKNLEYLMIDHTSGLQLCKDMFSGLENLNYLFIQNCKIEEFTEDVFEPLVNLETCYFTGNALEQFNANAFLNLQSLKIFGLYNNSLSSSQKLEIDYQIYENLPNLETISFAEENIRLLNFETFKNLKNVQLVIGRTGEDIVDFLENKNINIQWTSSDSDLTEDVDLSDPNIQICA